MHLQRFLRERMAALGLCRRDIPRLLNATNPNTTLLRFDALMRSSIDDASLLAALRTSVLVGEEYAAAFDASLAATEHQQRVDADESARVREMQARRDFVPHVWVEHERRVPEPIFVVAWLGIDLFKRMDLPAWAVAAEQEVDRLLDVARFLRDVPTDPSMRTLMKGPFGRATHFHFRTTYDEYYVYSIAEQCFIERREGRPPSSASSAHVSLGRRQIRG